VLGTLGSGTWRAGLRDGISFEQPEMYSFWDLHVAIQDAIGRRRRRVDLKAIGHEERLGSARRERSTLADLMPHG